MAKKKDRRFKAVSWMIHTRKKNGIKQFADIFDYIPRSIVARELRTNNNRMLKIIENPLQLSLLEIDKLAKLFACTPEKFIKLIRRQKKNPVLNQRLGLSL